MNRLFCSVLLLFLWTSAHAQLTNGTIGATLVDPSGAAVTGAPVTLKNPARNITLTATSDATGRFLFPSVPPGDYTLVIGAPGFKTLERSNVILNVNQRLTLGDIQLEVGAVTETIEVSSEAVTLKTESAERSNVLSAKQVENIAVNGRSYLALAGLTPGVVATGNFQVAGTGGLASISANGARTNQNQLLLNGISNVDTGNNGDQLATISLDSVQEFRILTGVYQAEYGRSAGAQIIVQTRSGTNQFHGSAYYYRRHDSMNANAWNRNRDNQPRQLYRFQNPGYTVGGPVIIPGVWEKMKDRLFFFWSQEYQRQLQPEGVRRVRVPTPAEKTGDFSQSLDRSGRVIPTILDPVGRQPFANGRIPASRIFAPGQALLNFFPEPNRDQSVFLDFNYETQISTRRPRREDLLRMDYNVTDSFRLWGHFINNNNIFTSPYGSFVLGSNLGIININDGRPGKSFATGFTWVVSPVMTSEFTFGFGRNDILIEPTEGDTPLTRGATGINLPLLFPNAVQRDFFPSFSFNGNNLTNQPTIGTNNAPFVNFNDTSDFSSNTTRIFSGHTFKFGAYVQFSRKDQTSFANANGNYNWGDNPNNPIDTNFGYSNALLGVYNTRSSGILVARG
ncbi:MAG: Plug and carboxypeptidase regulatory-like domain-containing protein [Bryobacterales bacterium]|nr:Plug and carboxypeptidase regulatory-like domain-containing protein [Bryobacterales bacterium]